MDVKHPHHLTPPSSRIRTKTVIYSYRSSPYADQKVNYSHREDHDDHAVFVWRKKEQEDGLKKLSSRRRRELEEQRARGLHEELQKLQEARRTREEARMVAREEKERMYRENEMLKGAFYQTQEEAFFLKQEEVRSRLRMRAGRAQPIDNLALYIVRVAGDVDNEFSPELHMEIPEGGPCDYLIGLTDQDLKTLLLDIDIYSRVHADRGDIYRVFWEDILRVVKNEHYLLEERVGTDRNSVFNKRIADDIVKLFKCKTVEQLNLLQSALQSKLCNDKQDIDVTYWEEVIRQLKVEIARQSLLKKHNTFVEQFTTIPSTNQSSDTHLHCPKIEMKGPKTFILSDNEGQNRNKDLNYSNGLLSISAGDGDADATDIIESEISTKSLTDIGELGEKYNPRKPLFHNTVHTGYSWNKYNRTHYDKDNPPPKTIFGYKFNIFYPDLMDKSKPPVYTIEACGDNADFAVLRFHAGPPYQDVAFRILNRKWVRRRGSNFRNSFDGNMLQLWFLFERTCYRR